MITFFQKCFFNHVHFFEGGLWDGLLTKKNYVFFGIVLSRLSLGVEGFLSVQILFSDILSRNGNDECYFFLSDEILIFFLNLTLGAVDSLLIML